MLSLTGCLVFCREDSSDFVPYSLAQAGAFVPLLRPPTPGHPSPPPRQSRHLHFSDKHILEAIANISLQICDRAEAAGLTIHIKQHNWIVRIL